MKTIKTFDGEYTFTDQEFAAIYLIVKNNLADYDRASDMLADYGYDNAMDFNISAVLDYMRAYVIENMIVDAEYD